MYNKVLIALVIEMFSHCNYVALDVSADLTELGRTPVTVVCAGVKSILDIGRTIEYLETQGVTVASYGGSQQFPAFFTPESGFEAPYSVTNSLEAAKLIGKLFTLNTPGSPGLKQHLCSYLYNVIAIVHCFHASFHFSESNLSFGVGSGMVIGVPVPSDGGPLGEYIEQAIKDALVEAKYVSLHSPLSLTLFLGRAQGITGKAVTPFLLERVHQLSGGQSLEISILTILYVTPSLISCACIYCGLLGS